MTEPLRISVEIAQTIRRNDGFAVAEIIDARVRPLVDALQAAQRWSQQYSEDREGYTGNVSTERSDDLEGWPEVSARIDAALKAAGAE